MLAARTSVQANLLFLSGPHLSTRQSAGPITLVPHTLTNAPAACLGEWLREQATRPMTAHKCTNSVPLGMKDDACKLLAPPRNQGRRPRGDQRKSTIINR